VGRNGFRENNVVIWRPNQIFDKFGREGDVPQGKSPFRFGTKGTEKTQRASSVGVKLSDAALGGVSRNQFRFP
jgi:hypothetical protein